MRKRILSMLTTLALLLSLAACGSVEKDMGSAADISPELHHVESVELKYAQQFQLDRYQEGYTLITIPDCGRFLVIPEEKTAPRGLDKEIICLQQPIEHIYLAATAAMDMFASIDALDCLRFTGQKAEAWYVEAAKEAMERGDILYAGKYSAPDYEQILAANCSLAIENTMIYHAPEVKENLEKLGVPVLVDCSSYERNPLGRTEWVKLYGVLAGREEQAQAVFDTQCSIFDAISGTEPTGKTVVFFYITSSGEVSVRKSSDYMVKMIKLAGGTYFLDQLGDEESATSTVTMQMEEFYSQAKDVDYIIYNSAIDGEVSSISELQERNPLLKNFKAVQDGNVYCTRKNLYQSTMSLGTFTADIHGMLTGQDDMTFLFKLR